MRTRISLVLASCLVAICFGPYTIAVDDDQPHDKQGAAASAESDDAVRQAAKHHYELPKGGVKELLTFLKQLRAHQPKTNEEIIQHGTAGVAAMKRAAEKIRDTASAEDRLLDGYDEAMDWLLFLRSSEVGRTSPVERARLVDDIRAALAQRRRISQELVDAASALGAGLEYARPPQTELAAKIYSELGRILANSSDANVAKQGAKLEGAARRLNLVGKPLQISGTFMDGSKLDWARYRGKVVLVDFWATWCGPCLGELPNIRRNYELYHDAGFEVVAISLDDDRRALESFLETARHPWPTVHDGQRDANEVANRLGIFGLPAPILVDKEGKVVSINARGRELEEHLARLLGPVKGQNEERDTNKENRPDSK